METTQNALHDIKVGDIFVSIWGYEQTNADYYQVVELKGTCTLILKRIKAAVVIISNMYGRSAPIKDVFTSDKTITKRIKPGGTGFGISSYASARLHTPGDCYRISWYG